MVCLPVFGKVNKATDYLAGRDQTRPQDLFLHHLPLPGNLVQVMADPLILRNGPVGRFHGAEYGIHDKNRKD